MSAGMDYWPCRFGLHSDGQVPIWKRSPIPQPDTFVQTTIRLNLSALQLAKGCALDIPFLSATGEWMSGYEADQRSAISWYSIVLEKHSGVNLSVSHDKEMAHERILRAPQESYPIPLRLLRSHLAERFDSALSTARTGNWLF